MVEIARPPYAPIDMSRVDTSRQLEGPTEPRLGAPSCDDATYDWFSEDTLSEKALMKAMDEANDK